MPKPRYQGYQGWETVELTWITRQEGKSLAGTPGCNSRFTRGRGDFGLPTRLDGCYSFQPSVLGSVDGDWLGLKARDLLKPLRPLSRWENELASTAFEAKDRFRQLQKPRGSSPESRLQSWEPTQETAALPERSCLMRPLLLPRSTGRKSLNQWISGSGLPLAAHSMVAVRVLSTTFSCGPMSMVGNP